MKKLLLTAINSKYIHSNLAVFSLKAFAKEYSDSIFIKEFTINNLKENILQEIYKARPDVLFFSVYIWNVDYVETIGREFKKLCPSVPVFVGGPEVSYECEAFLKKNTWADGILVGEGEETFKEVASYFVEEKGLIENIKGLILNQNGNIVSTGVREPIDMNSMPFAYDDSEDFSNRIVYYETSRGCPFSCSYCLSSVDKHLRFKDMETVKKELLFFIERRVKQVKFVDRTFNCDHNHALSIWKFIKEHDNGVTNFHFEVSADIINDEELEVMKDMRPGLIQLEIGVQSVNEATIREIHRTMKLDKLEKTVLKIQSFGNIHEHLDLIAGLPYEDFESFKKSFNRIYALKPDDLQLGFLKVLKGSYMYEHAKEYGVVSTDIPPYEVMSTKWISYDEIIRLKRVEEMLEVYYNSGQFEVTMKVMELIFDTPFEFFDLLGAYYEENGLMDISHARIRRYEILLDFIKSREYSDDVCNILREAMVYDVYSRENAKTRPSFADDMAEWKELSRERCKDGKLNHLERFHYDFPGRNVRTIDSLPKKLEKENYILFDYH